MKRRTVRFSGHAVRQMFERGLRTDDVVAVISDGEIIKEYPDDTPYPSYLLLGTVRGNPVHVVVAFEAQEVAVVITAYLPDKRLWNDDFKTRRGE